MYTISTNVRTSWFQLKPYLLTHQNRNNMPYAWNRSWGHTRSVTRLLPGLLLLVSSKSSWHWLLRLGHTDVSHWELRLARGSGRAGVQRNMCGYKRPTWRSLYCTTWSQHFQTQSHPGVLGGCELWGGASQHFTPSLLLIWPGNYPLLVLPTLAAL